MSISKSKRHRRKPSRAPQFLIVGAVIVLIGLVLLFKQDRQTPVSPVATTDELPAAQLDRALAEKRPTLAFFHSNTCLQCTIMMETVDQVYPDFAEKVVLVDINVYDEENQALLQRVGLQYIPTLIFYDQTGQGQVSVGVMEAEQLRQTLATLAEGQ